MVYGLLKPEILNSMYINETEGELSKFDTQFL